MDLNQDFSLREDRFSVVCLPPIEVIQASSSKILLQTHYLLASKYFAQEYQLHYLRRIDFKTNWWNLAQKDLSWKIFIYSFQH